MLAKSEYHTDPLKYLYSNLKSFFALFKQKRWIQLQLLRSQKQFHRDTLYAKSYSKVGTSY